MLEKHHLGTEESVRINFEVHLREEKRKRERKGGFNTNFLRPICLHKVQDFVHNKYFGGVTR